MYDEPVRIPKGVNYNAIAAECYSLDDSFVDPNVTPKAIEKLVFRMHDARVLAFDKGEVAGRTIAPPSIWRTGSRILWPHFPNSQILLTTHSLLEGEDLDVAPYTVNEKVACESPIPFSLVRLVEFPPLPYGHRLCDINERNKEKIRRLKQAVDELCASHV